MFVACKGNPVSQCVVAVADREPRYVQADFSDLTDGRSKISERGHDCVDEQ